MYLMLCTCNIFFDLSFTISSNLLPHGFNGSDWVDNVDNLKSTGTYAIYLNRNYISWKFSK